MPIALLIAVLIAYSPAIKGAFIWDDDYYVVNNLALRTHAGIQQIWLGIFPNLSDYAAPQYYPMTFTSLWIDYRIWGLNPVGYHLTNLILHAALAWTLFVVLRRLQIPGAALAAFAFALHPVHVESVAWITERKNVLSGLFYMLSLLVYLRYAKLDGFVPSQVELTADGDDPGYRMELPAEPRKVYALALLLFLFALLSKSVTATLPAAILLLVWLKRRQIDLRRDMVPLIPFFVLGLGMSVLTSAMERQVVGAVGHEWSYSFAERMIIAGQAAWFYVGKLLWPVNLAFIYDKWPIEPARVLVWLWPVSAVAVVCAALAQRKKWGDGPLIALLFYGGTILPALGFFNYFPMRYAFVADHFVYLASLGLIVAISAGLTLLARRWPAPFSVAAGGVLCVVLGVLSFRQAAIYKGPEALWTDTIRKSPNAWMAHNNLGTYYLQTNNLAAAEQSFERALSIKKDFSDPMFNLGRVAEERGNATEAERLMNLAVELDVQYAERDRRATGKTITRPKHAMHLIAVGQIAYRKGDYNKATQLLQTAMEIAPDDPQALTLMGDILRLQRQDDLALQYHARAIELAPRRIDVRMNYAMWLADNGKPEEAFQLFSALHRDHPENAQASFMLGSMYMAVKQWDQAIELFTQTLQAEPSHPAA
ncbi:MAG TPA: tetratricopeptide repeat protein, partial [Tepidisphaeraceae bacterium]|nr:tetratricopeptide repeat protein [Tepidisphaeraceae bacterium]